MGVSTIAISDLRFRKVEEPETPQERQEQSEAAAKLMLQRPAMEPVQKAQEEFIDLEALRLAAETGNLEELAKMDKRLKLLVESDDTLQGLMKDRGSGLQDPVTKAALDLYRESFMALEGRGRNVEKEAFQAVMRDDAVKLKELLDLGVRLDLRNGGGQTLLQLAQERGKQSCEQVLIEAGASA